MKRLIWLLLLTIVLTSLTLGAQNTLQVGVVGFDEASELSDSLLMLLQEHLPAMTSEGKNLHILNFTRVEVAPVLTSFVLQRDPIIIDYLTRVNSLDYLLIVTRVPLDTFQRVTLELFDYAQSKHYLLYDRLEDKTLLEELLLASATHFRSHEQALVLLEVQGNNLTFSLDGEPVKSKRLLLVDTQEHSLRVEGEDYLTRTVEFQLSSGEIYPLKVELEKVALTTTLIFSQQGVATALLNGLSQVDLPYYWDHLPSQRSIIVEKNAFAPANRFVKPDAPIMAIQSKPEYMSNSAILLEARDATYRSLGRTILLFGATLVVNNLPYLKGNQPSVTAYQPLKMVIQGAFYISLWEGLWRMFDYSRKTEYSAL